MSQHASFKIDPAEAAIIHKIVDRAVKEGIIRTIAQASTIMDLTACHMNGMPLKLAELLKAPKFDFAHDVYGIHQHISRTTGKIGDCFVPRYAQPEGESNG